MASKISAGALNSKSFEITFFAAFLLSFTLHSFNELKIQKDETNIVNETSLKVEKYLLEEKKNR